MRQRISSDGGEVAEARENARLDIERSALSFSMKAVGKTLTDQLIVTNYVYDPEKTEQLRKQTSDKVEPVLISEGEVIVKRGEVISQDAYRQLQLVGLISDRQSLKPLFGTLIVSALMTLLLFGFISRSNLRYAKMGRVKVVQFGVFSCDIATCRDVRDGFLGRRYQSGFVFTYADCIFSVSLA